MSDYKKNKNIRLGIIGSGRIAKRFVPETKYVNGINVEVVYNPNLKSAENFAKINELNIYTDKKQELYIHCDAVYIASPHNTHYEYIKDALEHGKHVLCEKPMVLFKMQAEEVFKIAEENNLVLMEGIKTAYCPGFQALLDVVQSGKIGEVYDVEACFTKLTQDNLREMTDTEYGGSFLELGTYSMLPIMKILGLEEKNVIFHKAKAKNGIDIYTKASFDYGDKTGLSKTGLGVKSEGQLMIAGTQGYILVQAPWWLTKHFEVRYEDSSKKDIFEFSFEGQGLRYEIKYFKDMICSEKKENYIIKTRESIWLAEKMEHFLDKDELQPKEYCRKG